MRHKLLLYPQKKNSTEYTADPALAHEEIPNLGGRALARTEKKWYENTGSEKFRFQIAENLMSASHF
jgi:hypothetical protein